MTLPTTNISLGQIQTEYGGANPANLSEYYRSGSYVPTGQTSAYGTIPTSGSISIGVFRGTTKFVGTYSFSVTIGTYSVTGLSKGYSLAQSYGSISGNYVTSAGTIDQIYTSFAPSPLGGGTYFTGVSSLNTNWTSLTIGSQTFTKATATVSGSAYLWTSNSNLYGTNGTVVSCVLTI